MVEMGGKNEIQKIGNLHDASVAMAIADVFSKNGYTVPNKIAKILRIFDGLETLKSQWVISLH